MNNVFTVQKQGILGIPGRWTQELEAGLWTLGSGCWTMDAGLWTLAPTLGILGSGHQTLLLTGSEQNQNPVSDSIESIDSNVAISRNFLLTSNTTLYRNNERNFRCEKLNYILDCYQLLAATSRNPFLKLSPENTSS